MGSRRLLAALPQVSVPALMCRFMPTTQTPAYRGRASNKFGATGQPTSRLKKGVVNLF